MGKERRLVKREGRKRRKAAQRRPNTAGAILSRIYKAEGEINVHRATNRRETISLHGYFNARLKGSS